MMEAATAYDPIPLTVEEAIAKWDAGESVFSVELGGLGPGYEMSIQGLAFELMRGLRGDSRIPPIGVEWADGDSDAINAKADEIVRVCNKEPWAGFSGAQVGAAKSLAMCVLRRPSYRAAMREPEVKDRLIQVCKLDLRK